MPQPRVLISDALSPAAVQIFKDRGLDVDFQPDLGKDKDKLAAVIGQYDGLAIRSATKVTAKILEQAQNLKVIGRAGIGVDNVEIPAATAKGIIVMNTPFGNSITTAEHAVAMMFALARQIPQADASTQAGKWEKNRFMGVELTARRSASSAAATSAPSWPTAPSGCACASSPTTPSCRRSARWRSASRRWSSTSFSAAPTSSRCTCR
jgi:D-3-phosphoglycerate dehydrogenase